jgi:TfoX/Sxy family transcriptional regulator of competence genes
MASVKWIKPSQATLDYFEHIAPGAPLETRKMFGMPCRFLNGYVLVGVFQNTLMLHLSEEDRAACIAAGAEPFIPMGREMKSYVAITPGVFEDHDLKWWIVRGMRYLGSLEPRIEAPRSVRGAKAKPKAKAKAKAKAPKPKARSSKKVAPKPATKKAARKAKAKPAKKRAKRRAAPPKKRPAAKKRRSRR